MANSPEVPLLTHPLDHRIPPPIVMLITAAAMAPAAWLPHAISWGNTQRIAISCGVMFVGFLIAAVGFRTLRRAGTTIDPTQPERASSLVKEGIYRYSRNPMYVGMAALLLGWALMVAAPEALLGPVAFILYITRFQIVPEERAMTQRFGPAFTEYRRRSRRWI